MDAILEALKNAALYGGSFIVVLTLVVFVHEWGHFKAGRLCKMAAKSFSIGIGPALLQRKDKQGTTWKVCAIPMGGFVSWVDDTDPSSMAPASEEFRDLSQEEARARGHFRAQPVAARAFVVAAGPAMNFIFAILVFAALAFAFGKNVTDNAQLTARVDEVQAGSAADLAGIRPGDVVLSINGQPVTSFGHMSELVRPYPNTEIALVVSRDGAPVAITAKPTSAEVISDTGVSTTVGRLGVGRVPRAEEIVRRQFGPLEALQEGAADTWGIVARTGAYVSNIFQGKASAEHIAGPAGIFQASGQIATMAVDQDGVSWGERALDLVHLLLQWAAILSVAVGIVNLLPIPILDGGHLLFYGIEALRGGRPLSAQAQEWALRVGLVMLGSLFLFATWNDIRRIFFS